MNGYGSNEDEHQPLMWIRGHAIYAAYFIVIVYVASMLITSLLMLLNFGSALTWAVYDSALVLKGQVWRVFTYGLVNPPDPTLRFVMDMFIIGMFGRELEKFFGRHLFLRLYLGLYLLPPLLLTLVGLRLDVTLAGETGALAVFVAFAALYPEVAVFFGLLAKWVAAILVAIFTLVALAYHSWVSLLALWATTGYAYVFVRFAQGRFTFPSFRFGRRQPKLQLLPDLKPKKIASPKPAKEDSMAEMDALLDKIAKSGLSSLTTKERAQLTKAREALMQKKSEGS